MSEKIKILYLESIPNDSEFINAALKNPEVDFEISVVTHLANFLETITIVSPDVILTDCSTSSFNTFQALKILGNNSLKVPLILLTVKSFEDTALSLLERGACDYLFKDELTRLPQAIKNATEKHQLEVKQQELLNKLAARDEIEHINGELDLFLNTIDEVFFSRDMIKSQLIRISPECERVYGYNVAEFMANQNLHNSMIYPDDMHIKQSHLAQLKNGDRVMSSYRIVHKDGSTRWVQTKIIPTLNNNGILVRIDGISRDITEAIKAGEKLKLSEERYRTLIENSSDMLMVSNQNGLITYTSPNIKKILGYTAEEFDKERKSAESFHPDDPEHYKTPFIESRDNPGKVYHFTNRVKHAGGHWVWIEGTVTNLLHVPSVNGVVTNFRDVSERKKNEELLEKNHVELQQALDTQASILNALPPNIALLNEHGKILAVNQSWKKFANSNNLGLPNYGIGYNYLTISEKATGVDKITAVKIAKGIKAVIAGSKKEYCMEYPCHAPNQKRWFQMQVSPLVDKAQRGAVVLHINITARKIAENKQLESEGRYRQIVETAQEGIWLLDDKNRTVFVNKKMCDILGYTAREMMGRTHYSFKDAEEKKKAKKRTERRKQGISETSEATFITKSGKLVWTNGSANGIFDADGKYKGALGMFTDITQRKLDEGAIKRSEANLSAIIENTTDQVYSLDKELRFISFNKQFKNKVKRIFNRDVQQGDNAMDLLVGSDPLEISEWRIVYAKGLVGEVLQFVKEFNEDGKKAFISFSINPIKEAGKVIGLSCFARDITQQKTDDEALKRSEANLFGIIENTSDMVYSLDTDLRYIAFNSAFKNNLLQAYGFDLKQGDHILAYLDGPRSKEANGWKKIYAEALTGKTLQFVKEFNVNKNRSYISFSINPIWNSNEVIGLSCFTRDITQQKTDEIALKKSEASMRTIFNNTDMSYVLIDASLKVVSFNSLAELYATEQLNKKLEAGDSVFDYFDNGRRTLIADVLKQAKAGSLVHYQVNYDTNGTTKWFDITWAGIKNHEGENLGYLLTNKEVTAQKKLEIEREKITADLLQRNKDLEQFTYIISHNLRAPVANIMGLSSLLTYIDPADEEYPELVSGIDTSAHKLDEVILDLNQILQVNNNVSERMELVSICGLIDDIKVSINNLIINEDVKISCDFTRADAVVSFKSYLHSIFYNLILNSIKYHKSGIAPVINIRSKIFNGKISISYKDNGRGIDMVKNSADLFGLYKRFDTSVEGKGMGLFMVKMQVKSLGGTMKLKSELNKGVRFEFEFPTTYLHQTLIEQ